VAGGAHHSLALRADGSIVSWGEDSFGQVSNTPSGTRFTQVAAGGFHSLALRIDGSVVSWGNDSNGQVSNSPGGVGFELVAAGLGHSLALRTDGSIKSWGYDGYGEVSESPTGTGFTQVVGSYHYSFALRDVNTGVGFCFGDGSGTACPCGANGNPGQGCANSGGVGGAMLDASGNAYFSGDTFQLQIKGVPGAKPGLCMKGSDAISGGNPVGEGLLCTGPQRRSQVIVPDSGGSLTMDNWRGQPFGTYPGVANVGVPTYYQWWYRDPQNTCNAGGYNFTNGWVVTWRP